ncbi:S-layer homology domain-containing protein [Saccharibacillus sp. CPCC 101409]|uniref:S-layer homology domain-containing protein n=1 Tax=Saccharibacillus sp. CPCC 101409 TaxID=3058041 RepID=UPI0026712434|nr:S-layer homology domain-containing protein [Saccharibacillus sp. CPCC 101409]MDO3409808.1 S-layer homology domain-containing protein [Saccharibacillus sp. CPCC 101409]
MKKKLATTILSASVLTASLGGSLFAAAPSFKDLKNVPGQDKIEALQAKGVVKGVSSQAFAPNAALTQAQAVQFIAGGFELKNTADWSKGEPSSAHDLFPAVKSDAWYADAFLNAYHNQVGIPESVDPSAKITREAYVDYLIDALKAAGNLPMINILVPEIADQDAIDIDVLGSVQLGIALDIVELDADKNFKPNAEITRAEAVVMLYNAIEYMNRLNTGPSPDTDAQAPTSGSYAPADNGKTLIMYGLQQALEQNAGKDVKYFVAIDLFASGSPLDPESQEVQAEVSRLQGLGYDVSYDKVWGYSGPLNKVDYPYVSGYFTAKQLAEFATSPSYGYSIHFPVNGDGSAPAAKDGAIAGFNNIVE